MGMDVNKYGCCSCMLPCSNCYAVVISIIARFPAELQDRPSEGDCYRLGLSFSNYSMVQNHEKT